MMQNIFSFSPFWRGAVAGALIWLVHMPAEAWDVDPLYSLWVFVAGFVAADRRLKSIASATIGVWLGQVVALCLLIDGVGPVIMLPPLSVLFFGTVQALAGAVLRWMVARATYSSVRSAATSKSTSSRVLYK